MEVHSLFNDYIKASELEHKNIETILEYLDKNSVHPTTLLPLIYFLLEKGTMRKYIKNKYFKAVYNKSRINNKEYFAVLTSDQGSSNHIPNDIFEFSGKSEALRYICNELLDNVYRHSNFKLSMVSARFYDSFMEFSVFDDGESIPGKFKKVGINIKEDYLAIAKALDGFSTEENIGTGLRSSLKITTGGMGGKFLVSSSRGALYFKCFDKGDHYDIEHLHGTLVSLSVPTPIKNINIYGSFIKDDGEEVFYL
ncbi:MAG: hypothetical protein QXL94_02460 [Candidatus Parvarchaeum sp.]